MSIEEAGYFILGITNNGNKFRPSDWVERIASVFANFDANRLCYNAMVRPARHDGQHCLFVASSLGNNNPAAYNFIMDFASRNHLQVNDMNQPQLQDVA